MMLYPVRSQWGSTEGVQSMLPSPLPEPCEYPALFNYRYMLSIPSSSGRRSERATA
jgi:hypothetical protein